MVWLVTANTNSCRIFSYEKNPNTLTLVKEMNHPASKLKSFDLASDGPGHYKSDGSSRGTFSPNETPKENEINFFSREIAKALDAARRQNAYRSLVFAIPPHMNGLIHEHLENHVKDCIISNIKKDYTHLKEHEILDALKKDGYP